MVGAYPDGETPSGGLCRSALVGVMADLLSDAFAISRLNDKVQLARTNGPGDRDRMIEDSIATACSPMSPLQASEFFPDQATYTMEDAEVIVPDVDCGDGYRQLRWREEIQHGDEFFGGRDGDRKWMPLGSHAIGSLYRPHTANSIYAPWAIIRRQQLEVDHEGSGLLSRRKDRKNL